MKFKYFHLLSLLSFSSALAQVSDSLFVPQNNLYYRAFDKVWENPIQYGRYPFKDFTETELAFQTKDLNLKRQQVAEKATAYEFKTQGIFNVNERLRLLGSFSYQMLQEKDLAFNLSSERTENQFVLSPHYIFVPKKGNWESQIYYIKGGLSYIYEGLDLGATLDYKNFNSFRKNDPRPSINTADYNGRLFVGYHFDKHQLSINGQWGRKSDAVDVDYVNRELNSPINDLYFIRFSNGYGRLINFSAYNNFGYKTTLNSGGVGYAFRGEKDYFTINYNYSKSLQTLYGKSAEGYTYFDESLEQMKYRLTNYQTDANYWRKGVRFDYMANLNFQSITGDNYSLTEMGQNYRMTLDQLALDQKIIFKNEDGSTSGIGLNATYSDFSAVDLLGSTEKYIKSLDLALVGNKDVVNNSKQRLNLELGAKAYFPLNTELNYVPASPTTLFYDNVIAHDQLYDQTSKLGPQLGIQFFQSIKNKTQLKIFTTFASLFALDTKMKDSGYYNGNPNLYFRAGLALFY